MEPTDGPVEGYPQAVAAWLGLLSQDRQAHDEGQRKWTRLVARWNRNPAKRRRALLALLTPLLETVEKAMMDWPKPMGQNSPKWMHQWLELRGILSADPDLWHKGALIAQMADQGAWPPKEPPPKPAPPKIAPKPTSKKPNLSPAEPVPLLPGVEETPRSAAPQSPIAQSAVTPPSSGPTVEAKGGVARVGFPVRPVRRILRGDSPPSPPRA